LLLLALLLAAANLTWGATGTQPPPLEAPHAAQADQLARGESLYMFYCATCHGRQGGGLEEARLAFPEDHRFCERCHAPRGPRQLPQEAMAPNYAFSIGVAPPLWGEEALRGFGDAAALYHYARAAMPRQAPGSLDDQDYVDIVAFILAQEERLPEGRVLDAEGLESIPLHSLPEGGFSP
jgi:mono/diheme cytochrome c family protein